MTWIWYLTVFNGIQLRGEAEAFAINAKAKAEAEQLAKKAEAWKEYKNAAVIEMVLDTLPKVCIIFLKHILLILHDKTKNLYFPENFYWRQTSSITRPTAIQN